MPIADDERGPGQQELNVVPDTEIVYIQEKVARVELHTKPSVQRITLGTRMCRRARFRSCGPVG